MADYTFFAAHLRFLARTTDRATPDIAAMMDDLARIADEAEQGGTFEVPAGRLRRTARALAGVAGFLQQHILPETVAAANTVGERQVRWVIDTSMGAMADLMTHAEMTGDGAPLTVTLPAPPDLARHGSGQENECRDEDGDA